MCRPERGGGNGILVAAAIAAAPAAALVWLVTSTPVIAVLLGVMAAACAAGIAVFVRNVWRDRGTLWRGESEALLMRPFHRRRATTPVTRPAIADVPAPAAIAARPRAAIVATRLPSGEWVASGEKVVG